VVELSGGEIRERLDRRACLDDKLTPLLKYLNDRAHADRYQKCNDQGGDGAT
jgi:hypothetical protein